MMSKLFIKFMVYFGKWLMVYFGKWLTSSLLSLKIGSFILHFLLGIDSFINYIFLVSLDFLWEIDSFINYIFLVIVDFLWGICLFLDGICYLVALTIFLFINNFEPFSVIDLVFFMEFSWILLIFIIIFIRLFFKSFNIKNINLIIYIIISSLIFRFLFLLYIISLNSLSLNYTAIVLNETLFNISLFSLTIQLFITLLLIIFFFILLYSFNNVLDNYINYEVLIILLICIDSLFLIIYSNDLILLYILLEVMSLSVYILVGLKRYSNTSVRSSIYYFILGSVASSLLLLGISLIYFTLDMTNISSLYTYLYLNSINNVDMPLLLVLGFVLLLIGLFFKIGIAPFHFWLADVYEGSSTIITSFIAIFPKIAYLYLLFNFYNWLFNPDLIIMPYSLKFLNLILLCVYLSLILGTFGAFYQTRIKRLLAYSSIVNVGFILLSISIRSYFGVFGAMYLLIIYIWGLILLFAIIIFSKYYNSEYKASILSFIVDLRSITHSNFFLSILLVIIFFSLSGLPPFIGFFGKLSILYALIMANYYYIMVFFILINVFSCIYYIRLIRMLIFGDDYIFISFKICWEFIQIHLVSIIWFLYILFFFLQPILFDLIYPYEIESITEAVTIESREDTLFKDDVIKDPLYYLNLLEKQQRTDMFLEENFPISRSTDKYDVYCTQEIYNSIFHGQPFTFAILNVNSSEYMIACTDLSLLNNPNVIFEYPILTFNHLIHLLNEGDLFVFYDITTLEELGRYETNDLNNLFLIQEVIDSQIRNAFKKEFVSEVYKYNEALAWQLYTSDVMMNGPWSRNVSDDDVKAWMSLMEQWRGFHHGVTITLNNALVRNLELIETSLNGGDVSCYPCLMINNPTPEQLQSLNVDFSRYTGLTIENATPEQLKLLENNEKMKNLLQYSLSNHNILELTIDRQLEMSERLLESISLDINLQQELLKYPDRMPYNIMKSSDALYYNNPHNYYKLSDDQLDYIIQYHELAFEKFWSIAEADNIDFWRNLLLNDFEEYFESDEAK